MQIDVSYSTQMKISYLQDSSRRANVVTATSTVPERLVYTNERPMPRASEQGIAGSADATFLNGVSKVFEETQFSERSTETSLELSIQTVPTQILPRQTNNVLKPDIPGQAADPSSPTFSSDPLPKSHGHEINETPSRNVVEMRAAFPVMMQPEDFTQGDTQTQEPFYLHHSAASVTTASPSHAAASPMARSDYDTATNRAKLELSQATAARLEQEKIERRSRTRSKFKTAQRKSMNTVACQCDCAEEDDEMVSRSNPIVVFPRD